VQVATRSLPRNFVVQLVKYLEWVLRIWFGIRRSRLEIIHAHSLAALLPAVLLKYSTEASLVYDAHELEVRKCSRSGGRQWLAAKTEKFLIRFTDSVIVVGDAIADWYADTYDIARPVVVRNVPDARHDEVEPTDSEVIRKRFSIDTDDVVFIYQGMLSAKRAIPRFLEVFSKCDSGRHIVFMGYGPLVEEIQQYEARFANIHYLPAVPPEKVLQYTVGADVGVCGMGTGSLSYRLSLPNKFFEYLFAGLPVIIGDRPEQLKIVESLDCGWRANNDDAAFISLINGIEQSQIRYKRRGALLARRQFAWEQEAEKLLTAYNQALQ
jgi:glycosyltransferase involved in cell wall biosynthesis